MAAIQQYEQRLQALQQQVDELRHRLNQDSTNSSRPPSSDPPHVKRRPPKPAAGRKRGGQPGHARQRAWLWVVVTPLVTVYSTRRNRFVERVLSVRETCRQQGRSLLEYLVGCCQAHCEGKAAPPLLPKDGSRLGVA